VSLGWRWGENGVEDKGEGRVVGVRVRVIVRMRVRVGVEG
jgi:hypothetical protein